MAEKVGGVEYPFNKETFSAMAEKAEEYKKVVRWLNSQSHHTTQYQGCRTWHKDGRVIAYEEVDTSVFSFTLKIVKDKTNE